MSVGDFVVPFSFGDNTLLVGCSVVTASLDAVLRVGNVSFVRDSVLTFSIVDNTSSVRVSVVTASLLDNTSSDVVTVSLVDKSL